MLTGRKRVKFPLSTEPGMPPEHCRLMSPRRSVRPSARTCKGTLVTWHRPLKTVCAKAPEIEKERKAAYNKVRRKENLGPIVLILTVNYAISAKMDSNRCVLSYYTKVS